MKDEYVIVNKTKLLNRIEELNKQAISMVPANVSTICYKNIDILKEVLSQSILLIPEIENAFNAAKIPYKVNDYGTFGYENAEHYIEKLKLV